MSLQILLNQQRNADNVDETLLMKRHFITRIPGNLCDEFQGVQCVYRNRQFYTFIFIEFVF